MNSAQVSWQGPFWDKVLNVEHVLGGVAVTLCRVLSGPVCFETPQRSVGWVGNVRDSTVTSGLLGISHSQSQGPHKL